MAVFQLGSLTIPETKQELITREDGAKEVILYFDSYQTSCLGLVFSDAGDDVMEIVCLDGDKNLILPMNASEYPQLFDEQELYENGVTYQNQTIFDEVYHGRTAYEFLHKLPIYENTHPPLGKTLISIGIAVFGMNPFGWRIICVLFGSMMMPFIYLFGLRLTRQRKYAVLAAAKSDNSRAADVIKNWIRSRNTLEFLGTWEQIYNPNFKVVEFDHFKQEAGLHTSTPVYPLPCRYGYSLDAQKDKRD